MRISNKTNFEIDAGHILSNETKTNAKMKYQYEELLNNLIN
jgi:hypothetical protein